MKRIPFLLVALTATALASAQTPVTKPAPAVKYGANAAAGRTFVRDGVRLYFEVYGAGQPLLIVQQPRGVRGIDPAEADEARRPAKLDDLRELGQEPRIDLRELMHLLHRPAAIERAAP